MNFFLSLLVLSYSTLFSAQYRCVYKVNKSFDSIVEPVLVDLLHEGLLSGLVQLSLISEYETTRLVSVQEKETCRDYFYYISIDEGDYPKEIFEKVFFALKQQISSLDPVQIKYMISREIEKKLSDYENENRIIILNEFEKMAEQFFLERKQLFLDNLSIDVEEKKDEMQLNFNYILELFRPIKLTLVSSVHSSFKINATDREKKIIKEIITELGSRSLISLLAKKSDMDKLGDQIRNVPPLEFLAVIFSQKDLRDYMKTIRKSHFKWSNFIDEISTNMGREKKLPNYEDKIRSFADYMKVDEQELVRKAEEKDWSGFVNCLF